MVEFRSSTPHKNMTNLNALTHDEIMEQWFWLSDQPQTKEISNALDKCWEEICNREERREQLQAGWALERDI